MEQVDRSQGSQEVVDPLLPPSKRRRTDDAIVAEADKILKATQFQGVELAAYNCCMRDPTILEVARRLKEETALIKISLQELYKQLEGIRTSSGKFKDSNSLSFLKSGEHPFEIRKKYACLIVEKIQPYIFVDLAEDLKGDADVCKKAAGACIGVVTYFVGDQLTKERIKECLMKFPEFYRHLPRSAQEDIAILLVVVKKKFHLLDCIGRAMEGVEIVVRIIGEINKDSPEILKRMVLHYKRHTEMVELLLEEDSKLLGHLIRDRELEIDRKAGYICSQIKKDVDVYKLLPAEFESHADYHQFVESCMQRNYQVVRYLQPEVANRHLYAAAKNNVEVLKLIDQTNNLYRHNLAYIMAKLPQSSECIALKLRRDPVFAIMVLKIAPESYSRLQPCVMRNMTVIREVLRCSLDVYKDVPADIKEDRGAMMQLLSEGAPSGIFEASGPIWAKDSAMALIAAKCELEKSAKYREESMFEGNSYCYDGIPEILKTKSKGIVVAGGSWEHFIDTNLKEFIRTLSLPRLEALEYDQIGFFPIGIDNYKSTEELLEAVRDHLEDLRSKISQKFHGEIPYIGTPKSGDELVQFYARVKETVGIIDVHLNADATEERLQFLGASARCGGAWEGELVVMCNILINKEPEDLRMQIAKTLAQFAEEYCEEKRVEYLHSGAGEDVHIWNLSRRLLDQFLLGFSTGFDQESMKFLFSWKQFYVDFMSRVTVVSSTDKLLSKMKSDLNFGDLCRTYMGENFFEEYRVQVDVGQREISWQAYREEVVGKVKQLGNSVQKQRDLDELMEGLSEGDRQEVESILSRGIKDPLLFNKTIPTKGLEKKQMLALTNQRETFVELLSCKREVKSILEIEKIDMLRLIEEELLSDLDGGVKERFIKEYDWDNFHRSIVVEATAELKRSSAIKMLVKMGFFAVTA